MAKKTKTRKSKTKKAQKVMIVHPKRNRFTKTRERPVNATITVSTDIYQSSGVVTPMNVAVMLEYVTIFYNGAYTFPTAVPNDFARYNNLYDEYLVDSLEIHYMTACPAEYAADSNAYFSQPVANGSPWVYLERDYDDNALITTESQALNKGKPHSLFKSWKFKMRNEKNRRSNWLNTSLITSPNAIPVGANTITDQIPKRSSIKMYIPYVSNNLYIGRMYCTWNVRYKSIRTI